MQSKILQLVYVTAFACVTPCGGHDFHGDAGHPFHEPDTLMVSPGNPFHLEFGVVALPDAYDIPSLSGDQNAQVHTRAYNGKVPGPTIYVKPGQSIEAYLVNSLGPDYDGAMCNETGLLGSHFCRANTTNFHTHGFHVSPRQDDVKVSIRPNQTHLINITVPKNHMGGTHWYHPHHHHSTALQAGGGAHGALIVEDPEGSIPPEYAQMPNKVLVITYINVNNLDYPKIRGSVHFEQWSGGNLWQAARSPVLEVAVVNGAIQPTMDIMAGKWYRFRLIYAAIHRGLLIPAPQMTSATCSIRLIAKDGIYLDDAPRRLKNTKNMSEVLFMAPGNRADFIIACVCNGATACSIDFASRNESAVVPVAYHGKLLTINVVGGATMLPPIPPSFRMKKPCYLDDLQHVDVPQENKHTIKFDIKSESSSLITYDGKGEPMWNWEEGRLDFLVPNEVYEFTVQGVHYHPIHLHVVPFQIIKITPEQPNANTDNFNEIGDWADTLVIPELGPQGNVTIRIKPDFFGDYVLHCHLLDHEDMGMMGFFKVNGSGGETSQATCHPSTQLLQDYTYEFHGTCSGLKSLYKEHMCCSAPSNNVTARMTCSMLRERYREHDCCGMPEKVVEFSY